jgi:hypothetical protein
LLLVSMVTSAAFCWLNLASILCSFGKSWKNVR